MIVRNLNKSYPGKTVLKNFSARFEPGIHFIFAPNGSGKTTFLNVLGGSDRSYSGKLILGDIDATADPELANLKRAYLPSDLRFYPGVSAYEFLCFIADARRGKKNEVLKTARETFGLDDNLLRQATESLSLGQKKRLFLSATLLPGLSHWILDEPTNGLDQNSREALITILRQGQQTGKTVILATHDRAFARELGVEPVQLDFLDRLPK